MIDHAEMDLTSPPLDCCLQGDAAALRVQEQSSQVSLCPNYTLTEQFMTSFHIKKRMLVFYLQGSYGHGKPGKVFELKKVISRPVKLLKTNVIPKVVQKSWKCVIFTHTLIKRIHIYIDIYSFNQTIVSHAFVSFFGILITRVYTKISPDVCV